MPLVLSSKLGMKNVQAANGCCVYDECTVFFKLAQLDAEAISMQQLKL